jgi:hypothetical protein
MFFQSHPFCVSLISATFALLPNDLSGKLRRAERKGTRATRVVGQCALLTTEVRFSEDNRSTYTRLARERAYTHLDPITCTYLLQTDTRHHMSKIHKSWPRRGRSGRHVDDYRSSLRLGITEGGNVENLLLVLEISRDSIMREVAFVKLGQLSNHTHTHTHGSSSLCDLMLLPC